MGGWRGSLTSTKPSRLLLSRSVIRPIRVIRYDVSERDVALATWYAAQNTPEAR